MRGVPETPVVAGHVYGLRIWRLSAGAGDFRLTSAAARHDWNPHEPRPAKCRKSGHHAPSADCTCGYYSFHQSPDSIRQVLKVVARPGPTVDIAGIAKNWGRMEVHATGMRSEFATPDVFFQPAGASDAFRLMLEEIAGRFGAEIWPGGARELLERMSESKPALAPEMTRLLPGERAPLSFPDNYRLAAITPGIAQRSTDQELLGDMWPIQPRGFWLETSLPSASLTDMSTSHRHRIVRLEPVTDDDHRSRQKKPPPAPGAELVIENRGRQPSAVKTDEGAVVGYLPQMVKAHLRGGTKARLLCKWVHLTDHTASWPQLVHVLLEESGCDRKLTLPKPVEWPKRKETSAGRRRRLRRAGGDGGGPVGPHDGPDG